MNFLRNLLGKKRAVASSSSSEPTHSFESVTQTAATILRLRDAGHPARKQINEVTRIVDQSVQVDITGNNTTWQVSTSIKDKEKALSCLEEGIALCPDDMDLLVAKACILQATAQFKSAEEVLDVVLSKAPHHFEAKMWKNHWESWQSALRFPKWDEQLTSLHPVIAAHLKYGHRVQVVRDGLQKTLAIVAQVQGPPFDSRTQVKVDWVLSKTPYGPLVAYYLKIIEPMGEPSIMEAFLPIFQPTLFAPMEGLYLVQQLAFTPYCFVVLVNGNKVVLNRRVIFEESQAEN